MKLQIHDYLDFGGEPGPSSQFRKTPPPLPGAEREITGELVEGGSYWTQID